MEYLATLDFPRKIAMGAVREPFWNTTVVANFGGWEQANQNWASAKHRYDVSMAIRKASDYTDVLNHFHKARGRSRSFPFKDFLDYKVELAGSTLVAVTGGLQLCKVYGTGTDAWVRHIGKPTTVGTIYRTNGATTTPAGGTVNFQTGLVTGITVNAGDTFTWSGEFVVPVRYDSDSLPASVPDRNPAGGELLVKCDSITLVEVRPDA